MYRPAIYELAPHKNERLTDLIRLAGGLTDFVAGFVPAQLPGGCLLDVAPLAVVFTQTSASGSASYSVNVPGGSAFVGTVLFFQWVHFAAGGLSTSSAAAHWIGY